MPKQIKKRITKRSTTKEEDVKGSLVQGLDFLKMQKNLVITAVAVVAAGLILYLGVTFYGASTAAKAHALEVEAYDYYYGLNLGGSMTEEERWKKALDLFRESVSIKATPTAVFYLGNCYYKLRDYEGAIREYTLFTEEYGDAVEILPVLYQKLSSAFLKANRDSEALDTLGKLASVDGGNFRDTALVLEARYYASFGNPAEELQKYKELVSQYPSSPWYTEAKAKVDSEQMKKAEETQEEAGAEEGGTPAEPQDNQAVTD